jgi:perosamine synthetase
MMAYPRQKLYDVNHFGFLLRTASGTLNLPEDDIGASVEHDFSRTFAAYTGLDDAIPLSRGRLAVYFAVKYAVSPKRRKIIMSAFTIFDLVNMVRVAGGLPIFIDTEPHTAHVSAASIENTIDDETAAVILTHYHTSNREIGKIADLCRKRGIILIEDCAISLGARIRGQHVGSFGDVALFSFGLFKFVATYFGGAVWVRSRQLRWKIREELAEWPRMGAKDLLPYAKKGLLLSFLTEPNVFRVFTFPIFRFGYLRGLDLIKNKAKNDPNPILRDELPDSYKRRPSHFQISEWTRQLAKVEEDHQSRVRRARIYYDTMFSANGLTMPEAPDGAADCFFNFPVGVAGDRDAFVSEIMKAGFDCAVYYYRNTARISVFSEYSRHLPNLNNYVDSLVLFPTYPEIPEHYVNRVAEFAKRNAPRKGWTN